MLQRSTHRSLTSKEISYQEDFDAHEQFMDRVNGRLGNKLEDTQHFDQYEDKTESKHTFHLPQEELEPEVADQYLCVGIYCQERAG